MNMTIHQLFIRYLLQVGHVLAYVFLYVVCLLAELYGYSLLKTLCTNSYKFLAWVA